jgi:peptidoglycan/LPS O-acetylase OafA/YrhL
MPIPAAVPGTSAATRAELFVCMPDSPLPVSLPTHLIATPARRIGWQWITDSRVSGSLIPRVRFGRHMSPLATPLRGDTPAAVAPPPRHPRFPLIDGLRAVAALTVLVFHAQMFGHPVSVTLIARLLAHLNFGVTIFFVISGFLLYRPLIAHRTGGPAAPATTDYFRRRILRIYPAYLALLGVLLVAQRLGIVAATTWRDFPILTVPNEGCFKLPDDCALGHTWSLVAEVTFYAVLPLYAIVSEALSRRAGRRWVAVDLGALGLFAAGAFLLRFVVLYPWSVWLGSSVAAYVLWFAAGMSIAVLSVQDGRNALTRVIRERAGLLWLVAAAIYVLLCLWLPVNQYLITRVQSAFAFVGFGLIAVLLLAPAVFAESNSSDLPRRLLGHPVMAWLGLVSYGIFLWHYVIALNLGPHGTNSSFLVVLALTLALSVPAGAASYYLVERPFLKRKYRRPRRSS